jgi:hypothetical protein
MGKVAADCKRADCRVVGRFDQANTEQWNTWKGVLRIPYSSGLRRGDSGERASPHLEPAEVPEGGEDGAQQIVRIAPRLARVPPGL